MHKPLESWQTPRQLTLGHREAFQPLRSHFPSSLHPAQSEHGEKNRDFRRLSMRKKKGNFHRFHFMIKALKALF